MKPEEVIGPAAVKALTDAGYTLVAPKEPEKVPLVTQHETDHAMAIYRKQFYHGGPYAYDTPWAWNVAHDWLVRTVLRRLLDALNAKSTVWGVSALRREWGLDP